ncbi:MAG: F0F1 ATP synthase subunit delta [Geminicoccaceae bacterium]|nr:F0F1 ATP synthase subunit delta [Geminicoccaceae bacterium]
MVSFQAGEAELSANSAAASGLASRYATALFELAGEAGALDAVALDLQSLDALVEESDDLRRMIRSPVLTRDAQRNAVLAVADKAGLNELTKKFLGVLADKRRLFALDQVSRAYRDMLAEHKGEMTARVTSAVPLSNEQLDEVKAATARFAGRAVSIDADVDPSLLGGLVVRVGSRMLDASLKTKLQHLEQSMRGIG